MLKVKKWRNKKYLNWVKGLSSSVSNRPGEAYHHLIGHGQGCMGGKASDLLCIPLTFDEHMGNNGIHAPGMGVKVWEERFGDQVPMLLETIKKAIEEGVITIEFAIEELTNQIQWSDEREWILKNIKKS